MMLSFLNDLADDRKRCWQSSAILRLCRCLFPAKPVFPIESFFGPEELSLRRGEATDGNHRLPALGAESMPSITFPLHGVTSHGSAPVPSVGRKVSTDQQKVNEARMNSV